MSLLRWTGGLRCVRQPAGTPGRTSELLGSERLLLERGISKRRHGSTLPPIRPQGLTLTGSDGLLKQLTETVVETALHDEMTMHLGCPRLVKRRMSPSSRAAPDGPATSGGGSPDRGNESRWACRMDLD